MLHLLRNSIDHGIEEPEDRIAQGKEKNGTIILRAFYQGSFAVIEITDDGKGIDREKVLAKAISQGIVDEVAAEQMGDTDVFSLIFQPGFSTKDQVSELSGRGVGMDVVRHSIESLQGEIEVTSTPGTGTRMLLKLPLTLAIVRVLLFDVESNLFALPMTNISEVISLDKKLIEHVEERMLLRWNDEYLPVVRMRTILGIPANNFEDAEIDVIILEESGHRVAIIVDKLIGRQEIVIKNLGTTLRKVPFVMGCTILSDRRIVLVLSPKEIHDTALNIKDNAPSKSVAAKGGSGRSKASVLIVDDSNIHRQQLRTILQREGFQVDESENGFEALKMVRTKNYSILCVDIVMPLMDGFELTRRLRALPMYRSIPLFLITSSTSNEDRERGLKVGANEFFQKPIEAGPIMEKIQEYTKSVAKD